MAPVYRRKRDGRHYRATEAAADALPTIVAGLRTRSIQLTSLSVMLGLAD